MQKLVYINFDFQDYKVKTLSQIKSFMKKGFIAYIITIINDNFVIYKVTSNLDLKKIKEEKICKGNKYKRYKIIAKKVQYNVLKINPQITYIRRFGMKVIFYKKCIRNISKYSKIVFELPTFPFEKTNFIKYNLHQEIECLYLKYIIKKYVNVFAVNIQRDCKKWNNMVEIFNGVNIENFDINKRIQRKFNNKKIKLIGIAHLNYWHGYDRIIKTIEDDDDNILDFTILSNDTDEKNKLEKYVKQKNLNNKVHFLEQHNINIMEKINQYDIAVGGIGYHRRGAKFDTSIKNKEYCAMGIPFIISCTDKAFPEDFKYIYKIDANDNKIDLKKMIAWYKKIANEKNYIIQMYNYAKDNLSFDKSIEKILLAIEKDK